ncbi:MAG: MerR family DNA-binding protein [Candidatus Rokubacteria bacterium]|nr:MerR family DNA-binding protein [Candidatus Rokubacteria bacterium]
MGRDGLLIGGAAARAGVTPRALRRYERAGILSPSPRTAAGYRVYGDGILTLLEFVAQARRLGFSLVEIRDIVAIHRAGRRPCRHVRSLVRRKAADVERALADLTAMRRRLRAMLRSPGMRGRDGAVCPHIEAAALPEERRPPTGITRRTRWKR